MRSFRTFLALYASLCTASFLIFPLIVSAASCCNCNVSGKLLCIQDPADKDCGTIKNGSNPDLKDAECTDLDPSQCKLIAEKGVCENAPVSAATYKKDSATPSGTKKGEFTFTAIPPKLNVPIPGLQFGTEFKIVKGVAEINFLAQYISAIYRYLLGISIVVASIMIVYGGFLYVIGATVPSINKGKEIITNTIIGTCLLFGTVTIFQTVNANIDLRPLYVQIIEQYELEPYHEPIVSEGQANPTLQGSAPQTETVQAIIAAAKAFHVDACLLLAHCNHESGLKSNIWNGSYAGNTKEKASNFGACQVNPSYVNTEALRKVVASVPPKGSSREILIEWILTPEGSAYTGAAAMAANMNAAPSKNEVYGLASFGGGSGAIGYARKAHNCTPIPLLFRDAVNMPLNDVLAKSCIYSPVATGGANYEKCAADLGICSNIHTDSKAQFVGTCATSGKKCYAMELVKMVQYDMSMYKTMRDKYPCSQ